MRGKLVWLMGVIVAVGLVVTGCDSDEGGTIDAGPDGGTPDGAVVDGAPDGGGSPDAAVSNADLATAFAAAYCDKLFDCCTAAEMDDLFGFAPIEDTAGCRIAYRTVFEAALLPWLAESEAAGRVELDEAGLLACAEALDAASCTALSSDDPFAGCAPFFTPKVGDGGACSAAFECTSGHCEIPGDANEGTCQPAVVPPGVGSPCPDGVCAAGAYCEGSTCVATKPDGQACDADEECTSGACVGTGGTGATGICGARCDGGGPGPGPADEAFEAVAPQVILAECDKMFDCCSPADIGERFGGSLFGSVDTVQECRTLHAFFIGFIAFPALHNDEVDGRVALDLAAFAACVDARRTGSCADYAAAGIDPACAGAVQGLVPTGQACEDHHECQSGYCPTAPGTSGLCAAKVGQGQPCTEHGGCSEGLYCATTCQPKKAIGAACSGDAECADAACVGDTATQAGQCALVCDGP